VAGRVKTRLCPPLSPAEAAEIAEASLADTLSAVTGCHADRKVLALEGRPGPWLPAGIDVIRQRGGRLDERLANAWAETDGWGVQIGMDTPQVTSTELDDLLGLLTSIRIPAGWGALLGPAADGGWWVIGLQGTDPHLVFPGVPMTTSTTGRAQRERLVSLGLEVIGGPTRRDIDTVADLEAVAGEIPHSRTGATAARILGPRSAAPARVA
jgi:glycosyltransferase A (GT-A) superfamily protein (DUF2064 family)